MLLPQVFIMPEGFGLLFGWNTALLYVGVGVAVYGLRLVKRYRDAKTK